MLGCLWQVLRQSSFLELKGGRPVKLSTYSKVPRCLPTQLMGRLQRQGPCRSLLHSYFVSCQTKDADSFFFHQHSLMQNLCVTDALFML